MVVKGKKVFVFDNGGETFDRYTILDGNTNVFGASVNPFHPQGFGMYNFTKTDELARVCERIGKKLTKTDIKYTLVNLLKEWRSKDSNIGKEVKKFDLLPVDVQKYIEQIIS